MKWILSRTTDEMMVNQVKRDRAIWRRTVETTIHFAAGDVPCSQSLQCDTITIENEDATNSKCRLDPWPLE